jgi:N-acetylglutamate synthase-like GNAT family acetyltransferase
MICIINIFSLQSNMEVEYRDSKDIDYEQLLRLQRSAPWCENRTLEQLRAAIENSQLLLTGWMGGKLVACTRVLTDYVYRAVIFDVIVDPSFQKKGLGRNILQRVVEHPSLKDVEYFFLYTHDKQDFYRRIGWEEYSGSSFRLLNRERASISVE